MKPCNAKTIQDIPENICTLKAWPLLDGRAVPLESLGLPQLRRARVWVDSRLNLDKPNLAFLMRARNIILEEIHARGN